MSDIVEKLRSDAASSQEGYQCVCYVRTINEAAETILALRKEVEAAKVALKSAAALIDCIEQGKGNAWWVNATDPENAVCHTDTLVRAALATEAE